MQRQPQSGPDKKRARLQKGRAILVQTGRAGGSHEQGNTGLPPTIDAEKFVNARTYEIAALQKGMRDAKSAMTVRAFQTLPRALRRRAASHDIRRLPKRLQAKALSEMKLGEAKPRKKTRSMLGKKFARLYRQRRTNKPLHTLRSKPNKRWLETHIWHAKRMHMTILWRHRLATKPTAKSYRATHRAGHHGCIVHDASYFQYVEINGPFEPLVQILDSLTVRHNPTLLSIGNIRYSQGSRELDSILYDGGVMIGQITVIWSSFVTKSDTGIDQRRLLLRMHPSMCEAAAALLRSNCLNTEVTLKFYDNRILTFEILGRRALEMLQGVLRPSKDNNEEAVRVWSGLNTEAGPGAMPPNIILGFKVYDPRLTFPPKLVYTKNATVALPIFASPQLASCAEFWDASIREKPPAFSKQHLDERRRKQLIPGTYLQATTQDDRIPILVSSFKLESKSPCIPTSQLSCSSNRQTPAAIYGLRVMIPAGWGQAFWQSFVHSEPKPAGIEQRQQWHFEAGISCFPYDYQSTRAYHDLQALQLGPKKEKWTRTPSDKRINYAVYGMDYPWDIPSKYFPNASLIPAPVAKTVVGVKKAKEKPIVLGKSSMAKKVHAASLELAASPQLYSEATVRVQLVPVDRGVLENLALIYSGPVDKIPAQTEVIGYVTTGGYSLSLGQGFAIGVIKLAEFVDLMLSDRTVEGTHVKVLACNIGKPLFRECWLSLCD